MTVPTVIVPLNIVYTNPFTINSDGTNRVASVVASPVFQSSHYFVTNDTAQYGSAFMRAQFNTFGGYGVTLGQPTIAPTQTFTVPKNQGQAVFQLPDGTVIGVVQVQWFSNRINQLMGTLHIDAHTVPIFLVDNAFLYDGKDWLAPGACCILGYHGAGPSAGERRRLDERQREPAGPDVHLRVLDEQRRVHRRLHVQRHLHVVRWE